MACDSVRLNVDSYYEGYSGEQDKPLDGGDLLESIAGALIGGGGDLGSKEVATPDMVGSLFSGTNLRKMGELLQGGDMDPAKPQAYLNYVLFEENGNIYSEGSGRFQADGDGEWKRIGTGEETLVMPRNGYLAVYLSNASRGGSSALPGGNDGDVFFDLLNVELLRGVLMEENHYYPFGLPMKDKWSARAGFKAHRFRYQGNEYITENDLNWMDFNFRQYDPQIGRFLSVDPLAAFGGQDSWSPYAAMGNSPGMMVDPDGLIVQEMANGNELPSPMGLIRSLFPTMRIGGATIWLPSRSGTFDYASGMTEEMKKYVELLALKEAQKIHGNNDNGAINLNNGNQNFFFEGQGYVEVSVSRNNPDWAKFENDVYNGVASDLMSRLQQQNGGSDRWMATDVLGIIDKGTLIPKAAFDFVEHTKTGRYLATGNSAKTADFVNTMKLAKPLTRGIAVVNVVATMTSVANDIDNGRFKSAGARTAVWGVAAGAAFIPVVGWGVSIGIGVADAIWGDDFYNWLEN